MVTIKSRTHMDGTDKPASSRLRKSIYLLPNLFTAGNMVLGILAIAYAINDSLTLSLAAETKSIPFVFPAELIIIATFADFFDGMVARATGTTSKFGMEFDSLSDLVSFGMAPAILIYLSVLRYLNVWGISITVFYIVCAAIRLARFNVQAQVEEKSHFMGLPSPAAAGILASYILLSRWEGWYGKGIVLNKVMGWYEENLNYIELYGIPVLTVIIGLVMVSTIPYPSLKKMKLESVKPWTLALIGMAIFWLIRAAEFTAFALLFFYLLWGLLIQPLLKLLAKRGADKTKAHKPSVHQTIHP
ncbi:MAG TPA: CDP-diacylglycerol--serine O-phosphatidyltransferase [bacterium]|nr:CDP-diacylglycerol--serine O-phosphatidyltransferase [bacterium]